ncbi:uncharacterized protein LOC132564343 [Ylistrum balloti]|uniref:uncharacterized protein LOC132564343 n=1 Tax=Ylistrum balloti TaxID=509963 RepID=UPI002905A7E0|nr:uncharacterized protein LOC132564343 [Ylistrum balloti]
MLQTSKLLNARAFFILLFIRQFEIHASVKLREPSHGLPTDPSKVSAMDLIVKANIGHDSRHLIEGDIVPSRKRNAVGIDAWKWGGHHIPYTIDVNGFSTYGLKVINEAIAQFNEDVSCIKYVPRNKEQDYVRITHGFGCHSSIGRDGGRQDVTLGDNCYYKGVVMHELTHAVGFFHEQSRYDRDKYVEVRWDNIMDGKDRDFVAESRNILNTLDSPYDYGSVMHYGATTFSKNGNPTLKALFDDKGTMGQRDGFSAVDIWKINKLYGCTTEDAPKPVWMVQDTATSVTTTSKSPTTPRLVTKTTFRATQTPSTIAASSVTMPRITTVVKPATSQPTTTTTPAKTTSQPTTTSTPAKKTTLMPTTTSTPAKKTTLLPTTTSTPAKKTTLLPTTTSTPAKTTTSQPTTTSTPAKKTTLLPTTTSTPAKTTTLLPTTTSTPAKTTTFGRTQKPTSDSTPSTILSSLISHTPSSVPITPCQSDPLLPPGISGAPSTFDAVVFQNSLRVFWTKPCTEHTIKAFILAYWQTGGKRIKVQIDPTKRTYYISTLYHPGRKFHVTIATQTARGEGPTSDIISTYSACGYEISLKENGTFDKIHSPYFGQGYYEPDVACQWIINIPLGQRLKVEFVALDFVRSDGCNGDFVKVNDMMFCDTLPQNGYILSDKSSNKIMFYSKAGAANKPGGFKVFLSVDGKTPKNVTALSVPGLIQLFWEAPEGKLGTSYHYNLRYRLIPEHRMSEIRLDSHRNFFPIATGTHYGRQYEINMATVDVIGGVNAKGTNYKTNVRAVCGRNITVEEPGVLRSPHYPNQYEPDTVCEWNLIIEDGYELTLTFNDLDLQRIPDCLFDYVDIEGIGRHCAMSDLYNATIVSRSKVTKVRFVSNDETELRGFELKYTKTTTP